MFITASWRSSYIFSKRSNACPSLVSSTANTVMAHSFLLPGAQKGALNNCCVQVSLKQPRRAGAHLQLEELGKKSDTALEVQCLLPEAQHRATVVLRLHQALVESAARCNFSAALHRKKTVLKKCFNLLKMSIAATFLPWRHYLQTYRKDMFFQENVQNPDAKTEARHLSPGTGLQQTRLRPESSVSSLALLWFQHLATTVTQSAINKSAKYHFEITMAAVKGNCACSDP